MIGEGGKEKKTGYKEWKGKRREGNTGKKEVEQKTRGS